MTNQSVRQHWHQIGSGYDVFWQSQAKKIVSEKELLFINTHLQEVKAGRVLDIGIGTGRVIANFLNNPYVQEIYGIDAADSMIEGCRVRFSGEKRIKGIRACDIATEDIPFPGKYDFVSAIRTLKYNSHWKEIIQKISDRLTKTAIFVFSITNKRAFSRFTRPEIPVFSATKKEIGFLCERLGLKPVTITSFSKLPDILYDISNNKLYVKFLLLAEKLLEFFLGDKLFGREFFVSVRKI